MSGSDSHEKPHEEQQPLLPDRSVGEHRVEDPHTSYGTGAGLAHRGTTPKIRDRGLDVEEGGESSEETPFSNKRDSSELRPSVTKRHAGAAPIDTPLKKQGHVLDSMTYHAEDLTTWSSLWYVSFTVWRRYSLWLVTLKLFGVSLVVALMVLVISQDPASLQVSKFTAISNFLRVFVGLLLGFFMSVSVTRWWACAEAFQRLCSAVRCLHIYLNSCGVCEELMTKVLRYGVVSAWILHVQLHIEALPAEEMADGIDEGWEKLRTCEGHDETLGKLLPEEFEILQRASDPPGVLWMWMGSIIGHMAEEGHIPGLASPTYGRIVGLTLDGFNAIRDVRTSITVQAPYIYVQMLSSLVHINNIVNAVSFGMTWGASMGTLLVYLGVRYRLHDASASKVVATHEEATADMQTLLVSFFFSCFGPFIYQALLEVSIALAQPFSTQDAVVPTDRILRQLEKDLLDTMGLAKKISWQQPRFKK